MRRALELAALAEGRTSPNPLVGALVLDQTSTDGFKGFVGTEMEASGQFPHFGVKRTSDSESTQQIRLESMPEIDVH